MLMKIAYITDSGTGCSIQELGKEGIISLPLQIFDGSKTYQDMENLSKNECISLLQDQKVLKTSQPSPGLIEEALLSLKNQGVELVVAVPICNGLSGCAATITAIAQSIDMKLLCIDTYSTAVVELHLIRRIKELYENGKSDLEVRLIVDEIISSCETIVIPTDLAHLARGGRMTPAAAKLAKLLRIVPILHLNKETGGRIDTLDKVLTFRKAIAKTVEYMKDKINDSAYTITIAHVNAIESAEDIYHKLSEIFPKNFIQVIELCNPVAAHVGLGGICVQYFKQV